MADAADSSKVMQCMEVWGGNEEIDRGVVMPGLDAWIVSVPYEKAAKGGDVHYVSTCAAGQITRVLVADVSGHGEAVAGVAGDLRRLMRRYVNDHDQRRFVRALNHDFTATAKAGIFATAVAMTFDAPTNRLMICNAGHPAPLHYSARAKKWTLLEGRTGDGNVPWGIEDRSYEQTELLVEDGDLIVVYTDALMEAADASGEMLGLGGLLKVVEDVGVGEPASFIPRLLEALRGLRDGNLTADDVTCMVVRPNGLRRRVPFWDKRLALGRWVASWFGVKFGWIR